MTFIQKQFYTIIFFGIGFLLGLLLDYIFVNIGFKHICIKSGNELKIKNKKLFYFLVFFQLFLTYLLMVLFDNLFDGSEVLFNIGLFSGQATFFREHCNYVVESIRV